MKIIHYILLATFIALPLRAADPISIEEFKKMSPMERARVIENAPIDQKDKLAKIEAHMELVSIYNGEEGLTQEKESRVIFNRGLGYIDALFDLYSEVWDHYLGAAWIANKKAGMTQEQLEALEKKLRYERYANIGKHLPVIHSLLFHMAASPQALELAQTSEQLTHDLSKKFGIGYPDAPTITRDEVMDLKSRWIKSTRN